MTARHLQNCRDLLLRLSAIGLLAIGASAVLAQSAPAPAPAQVEPDAPLVKLASDAKNQVTLTVNKSLVLTTTRPYKRVSVAQPDIADFNAIGANSVLLTAKKSGTTQIILWDDQDRAQVIDVAVEFDLSGLSDQYRKIFPGSRLDVSAAGGSIILRGRVPNATVADQAVQIAKAQGQVLNFLEVSGGQQVMLQVRFAEVSRSAVQALGVNAAIATGSGFAGSNIGQVNPTSLVPGSGSLVGDTPAPGGLKLGDQNVNPGVTLYGGGQIGSVFVEAFVSALRQNNLLRILAEPNVTAISGKEASFLAGGEFPIPVTQGGTGNSTAVTIEFREFGVKLKFLPVVLGDGRIRLDVAPEVSDLDYTTAVRFNGFVIPGLTQRKVTTTIELEDGQTFAIAGLLNNSVAAMKDVVPVLGDLPVLGALFRSVRYQRKETELIVMVTPHVVEPMNPGQVPPLPGEAWRHPTEKQLFGSQDLGGPVKAPASPPEFYGPRGFGPATRPSAAK